ncbi:hypothetical protein [Thermoflavimicrobium daqui]|uniref:Uncharacterized protein n=1 Tax=Thermoflavimicrobium daqui TaxID=2137476 RepID=A0A364K6V7_9BACL|nr:hypothetical protein [Thermoflavimicrobium daqui]RAL25942.1 hypothetical protein DL897_07680 [Thermoflavimicrobium daqui]
MPKVEMTLKGSSQDIQKVISMLTEHFDIRVRYKEKQNEQVDQVEIMVEKIRDERAPELLANKLFYSLAFRFFDTTVGKKLQARFLWSLEKEDEEESKNVRYQTIEIIHKQLLLQIQELIKQKKQYVSSNQLISTKKIKAKNY